jgi:hypothetical protein
LQAHVAALTIHAAIGASGFMAKVKAIRPSAWKQYYEFEVTCSHRFYWPNFT